MIVDKLIIPIALLYLLLVGYWYWIFELVDYLLKEPKLTKVMRILVGMLNAVIILFFSGMINKTLISYLIIFIILFVEFKLFYKDIFLKNLFCSTACFIHVLVIRSIITGLFSLSSGLSIYVIVNNPGLLVFSNIIIFLSLNIAIILVIKLLPLDQVRIVNEHHDQQLFIILWMVVNIIYLIFNSVVAQNRIHHIGMVENQVVAPCVILLGTYIMLNFAMKTGKLLGYKEKNVELEITVSKEQEYRSSIIKDAIISYEFDLNKDAILSGFEDSKIKLGDKIYRYSDMLADRAHRYIHPDDVEAFAEHVAPSYIRKEVARGKSTISVDYRRKSLDGNYVWCRAITNLIKDSKSGNILGFTYVNNIDEEKRNQMELLYKAERDPLTGLYNKVITAKLINEHLLFTQSHANAALFMIDVDNFKDINDHLGHVYGDKVLCDLSRKLSYIFPNEDIVGRIGGDEYIVYMKNGGQNKIVCERGEQICSAFRVTYKSEGVSVSLTASVGIALAPKDGVTFGELYNNADTALYAMKKIGKNGYKLYDGACFIPYQSQRK
ncbi:MAG: sensor domain-containing diguanylate cyclase [Erysipelotrichaceae bacterium]